MSTLIPGIMPPSVSTVTNGLPSPVACRIVSSKSITPLMNASIPRVVKSRSR